MGFPILVRWHIHFEICFCFWFMQIISYHSYINIRIYTLSLTKTWWFLDDCHWNILYQIISIMNLDWPTNILLPCFPMYSCGQMNSTLQIYTIYLFMYFKVVSLRLGNHRFGKMPVKYPWRKLIKSKINGRKHSDRKVWILLIDILR